MSDEKRDDHWLAEDYQVLREFFKKQALASYISLTMSESEIERLLPYLHDPKKQLKVEITVVDRVEAEKAFKADWDAKEHEIYKLTEIVKVAKEGLNKISRFLVTRIDVTGESDNPMTEIDSRPTVEASLAQQALNDMEKIEKGKA